MAGRFGAVVTAMVTPFRDDHGLDLDAARSLAAHLYERGSDSLVIAGSTGESPTLTHREKLDLFGAVIDVAKGRGKVLAGTGTYNTAETLELSREAQELGADGLLLVTPYYNKPGQAGVLHHFRSVIEASDVPVMLYDVPGRTGTQISLEVYEQVAALEPVVAVKDAVGDFARGVRIMQMGYALYSGDDVNTLGWLAHGCSGVVSVVGHAAGDEIRAMIDAFLAGDHAEALTIFTRLLPAMDAVMGVPNYGATTAKAALQLLGVLDNRNVRGPLVPLDEDEVTALRAGLVASGLLQ